MSSCNPVDEESPGLDAALSHKDKNGSYNDGIAHSALLYWVHNLDAPLYDDHVRKAFVDTISTVKLAEIRRAEVGIGFGFFSC